MITIRADIAAQERRVASLRAHLGAATACLDGTRLYAAYVGGLVEPGALDDVQLVEVVKTARTIEAAIVKIARSSPDRTVTTARITELCTVGATARPQAAGAAELLAMTRPTS